MSVLAALVQRDLLDRRSALAGWAVGLLALIGVEGALWPSLADTLDVDALLTDYPSGLKELFSLDAMDTGVGFLDAELFTLVLPALLVVFAVTRGARSVAGEEESGVLETVLAAPVPTTVLLLARALSLTVMIAGLALVVCGGTLATSALFSLGIEARQAATGTLAVSLLALELGVVALGVGAATGRRSVALGVAGTVAVTSYVVHVAGAFVDGLGPVLPWSPVDQVLAEGPLTSGLRAELAWPVVVCAVVLVLASLAFSRRDHCVA